MAQPSTPLESLLNTGWRAVSSLKAISADVGRIDFTLLCLSVALIEFAIDVASLGKVKLVFNSIARLDYNLVGALPGDGRRIPAAFLVADDIYVECVLARADTENLGSLTWFARAGLSALVGRHASAIGLSGSVSSVELAVIEDEREAVGKVRDVTLGDLVVVKVIEATLAAASGVFGRVCAIGARTFADVHAFARVGELATDSAAFLAPSVLECAWSAKDAIKEVFLALFWVEGAWRAPCRL